MTAPPTTTPAFIPGLGASREGVPFVDVSGLFSYGNNFEGEIPQVGNTFQWSDSLSWVKGSHTMKFGSDIRRQRFDQTLYYNVNGLYSYYGGSANDVGSDDLMPNYLLGLPDSFSQGSAQVENVRSSIFALFAQDSWKIKKNITLNYGLRWELFTPLTDISKHVQSFRPGQVSTIYPCQFTDPVMTRFSRMRAWRIRIATIPESCLPAWLFRATRACRLG